MQVTLFFISLSAKGKDVLNFSSFDINDIAAQS
jgi:hypothetical protein